MESQSGSSRISPTWPTAASTVVATIGYPVSHSMSPLLHQAAFDSLGLDWVSVAFEVAPGGAKDALGAMRALGIAGMSVTMPHKSDAAFESDELSPLARRLGAVNCIVNRDGVLVGDSTDGEGLLAALARATNLVPSGKRCAVIGAGGAARAAVVALADAGAAEVAVVNRTLASADEAAALAGGVGHAGRPVDISRAEIVIQATPVGMTGGVDPSGGAQFADELHAGQVVMDLVYAPVMTPFLLAAAQRGVQTVSGVGMLVHQAAAAIRRWTGNEPPVEHMWEVAQAEISAREQS